MFTVKFLDQPDYTDDDWKAQYAFLVEMKKRYNDRLSTASWEDLKNASQSFHEAENNRIEFSIFDGDRVVGYIHLHAHKDKSGKDNAFIIFNHLFENPPREFIKITANTLGELMGKHDIKTAHTMASNKRCSDLAAAWGSEQLNRMDTYRLYRKDANFSLIEKWLEECPINNPDLSMEFFTEIPEKYLDDYINNFKQYINDMPKEREDTFVYDITKEEHRKREKWRKKNGLFVYTFGLINEQDRLIGETNGFISSRAPEDMYQAMTGINREYRKRGLSRWLKAALFKKIGEDFTDNITLTTEMRAVNKPIQTINAQMGYKLVAKGHEYTVIRDKLVQV